MQQKLARKVMCHCAHVTGIVGCFALYPPNLRLKTSSEHSVKHIQLAYITRPKNAPPEVVTRNVLEVLTLFIISVQYHDVTTIRQTRHLSLVSKDIGAIEVN